MMWNCLYGFIFGAHTALPFCSTSAKLEITFWLMWSTGSNKCSAFLWKYKLNVLYISSTGDRQYMARRTLTLLTRLWNISNIYKRIRVFGSLPDSIRNSKRCAFLSPGPVLVFKWCVMAFSLTPLIVKKPANPGRLIYPEASLFSIYINTLNLQHNNVCDSIHLQVSIDGERKGPVCTGILLVRALRHVNASNNSLIMHNILLKLKSSFTKQEYQTSLFNPVCLYTLHKLHVSFFFVFCSFPHTWHKRREPANI